MNRIVVNWVRFIKIFVFVFALGCMAWIGKGLFTKNDPATPVPQQLPTSQSIVDEALKSHPSAAVLLICIGALDNNEWTQVLSDPDNSDVSMVQVVDAATDSIATRTIPISRIRDRVVHGVRSRAEFARVMSIAAKLASQLNPSAILIVGSPTDFNPLKKNVEVPAIATDETMTQLVGIDRSISVYHARPARKDDIMQLLVYGLKERSTTVKDVIFK